MANVEEFLNRRQSKFDEIMEKRRGLNQDEQPKKRSFEEIMKSRGATINPLPEAKPYLPKRDEEDLPIPFSPITNVQEQVREEQKQKREIFDKVSNEVPLVKKIVPQSVENLAPPSSAEKAIFERVEAETPIVRDIRAEASKRSRPLDYYKLPEGVSTGSIYTPEAYKETLTPTEREKFETQQRNLNIKEGFKKVGESIQAVAQAALDSATLGLATRAMPYLQDPKLAEEYPISTSVGTLAGYITPGSAFSKGAGLVYKPLAKKLGIEALEQAGKPILKKGVEVGLQEGIAGLGMGVTEGLIRGESPEEIAKRTGEYTLGGVVLGGGVGALSKAIPKAIKKGKEAININLRNISENPFAGIGEVTTGAIERIPTTPKRLGTTPKAYTVANKQLEDALSEYDEAISTLQNKYQTNDIQGAITDIVNDYNPKLIGLADEDFVKQWVKESDNIDLDNIIKKIEDAENLRFKEDIKRQQSKVASGLGSERVYEAIEGVKGVPKNKTLEGTLKRTDELKQPSISDDFKNITKADQLPKTTEGLEDYIKNATKARRSGINVNLNLFAEAQKRLASIKDRGKNIDFERFPDDFVLKKLRFGKEKKPIKERVTSAIKQFYDSMIDETRAFKKFDEVTGADIRMKAINNKRVGGTIQTVISDGLVTPTGKRRGKSLISSFKGIADNEIEQFESLLINRHGIDRAKAGIPIYPELTEEVAKKNVEDKLREFPHFKNAMEDVRRFMSDFRQIWLRDTGLISEEMNQLLKEKYPYYMPTHRQFDELEKLSKSSGAKQSYVDQPWAIQKAGTSEREIDLLENLFNHVNKTIRSAKKNEIAQAVLKEIEKNPEATNKFIEILPDDYKGKIDTEDILSVWDDGYRRFMKVKDSELQKVLKNIADEKKKGKPTKFFGAINNAFKALITQYNPLFTLFNVARDIPTAYIQGSENNPVKFVRNLARASKSVTTNSDLYKQYKAIGGEMGNFFAKGDYEKYITKELRDINRKNYDPRKIWNKTIGLIDTINNVTETIPRFAEFEKVLKETGDLQKALYESGEVTLNFSRGGGLAKKWDAFVPYFNASVQGADKLARQFKNKPWQTSMKSIVALTIPSIFFDTVSKMYDEEAYNRVSNRVKDDFYLFPKGDGEFIRIPKSRGYNILFSNLLQRSIRQFEDDEKAFKDFWEGAKRSVGPVNPLTDSILRGVLDLRSNKDFADRPIVPPSLQGLSNRYQYDEKTTLLAKELGNVANLSPKQIDYIMDAYTGIVGDILLPAMAVNDKDNAFGRASSVIRRRFITDSAYSNQDTADFYDNLSDIKTKLRDTKKLGKEKDRITSKISSSMNKVASNISDLKDKVGLTKDSDKQREAQKKIVDYVKEANKLMKNKDYNGINKLNNKFARENLRKR